MFVIVGVGVLVAVAVLVGVAVAVAVGVLVGVVVGVNVCVAVGVAVFVGVLVAVGVGVAVSVGVLVAVFVGVCVAVGVGVAVLVGVLVVVAVAVEVAVAVAVGVLVAVAVAVAVGATNVSVPLLDVNESGEPPVSSNDTLVSASEDVPLATVENWIVVRMPFPFCPGGAPVVEQPNVTLFAPVVGAGQLTLRPEEPRKTPLFALTNERMAESQVSVKS